MDFGRFDQLLEEERTYPTLSYSPSTSLDIAKLFLLLTKITSEPKIVQERPRDFEFHSVNYGLLSSLASQLDSDQRRELSEYLSSKISKLDVVRKTESAGYPRWNSYSSELPLIGEFLARTGCSGLLFDVLSEAKPMPGVILLLLQLHKLISLNWSVLSDAELDALSQSSNVLKNNAAMILEAQRQRKTVWKIGTESISVSLAARDTVVACNDLIELCRKSRYFLLKGALITGVNVEVNQDKDAVASHLQRMGFGPTLIESLNHADKLQLSDSPFDLKSSMGHLRSFMESLHIEACARTGASAPAGPGPQKWGETVNYLRRSEMLTIAEERFVTGLYVLISDEAVHPLIAEREYARLSRNVVIEYGLLLLKKLDKQRP